MSAQEEDKLIAKGFNDGYLLSQFEPQLLGSLLKSDGKDSAYLRAMASGKKQFERDKIMEQQQRIKEKNQQKKRNR